MQDKSSSSEPRISFRARVSNKHARITQARDRMKAWQSSYGFLDRPFLPKPKLGKCKVIGDVPVLPECLSEADLHSVDPGRGFGVEDWVSDIPITVTPGPIKTINPSPLQLPNSRKSLYRNLLTLLARANGPVSLQALVSYYSHPHSLAYHSTRSFNLLISLSIRHASFKTADLLLSQMKARGFNDNLETWKLRVRLMVRCGNWDAAWESVMSTLRTHGWKERVGIPGEYGDGMPLPLWTEFMTTAKKGAIRKSTDFGIREQDGSYKGHEKEELCEDQTKDQTEETLEALNSGRLRLVMRHNPSMTPKAYTRMPPRVVYFIVWMMLRAKHFQDARDMTRFYLAGLPPKLDAATIRASLDIIHLHVTCSPRKRMSLQQHYSDRRTVEKFIAVHPDIKPNAKTLFLLLRSLRRTTYSGTLARQTANAFRRKWGCHVVSRRVRQRIITFAVAEGNLDLAINELRKERQSRFQALTYATQTDMLGGTGRSRHYQLLRQPMAKIYRERGVNARRWGILTQTARQMIAAGKREKSG